MAADSAAISRLRRNLGDVGSTPAFSAPELATLLDEQRGDEDRALRQGLWELRAQAAKFHDYTTDVEQEKKSQVFENLRVQWVAVDTRILAAERAASGNGARTPARSSSATIAPRW